MLADFRVIEELARTSTWRLCRAAREQTGEKVLLRFLDENCPGRCAATFQQEYALLRRSHNEAIVRPLDFIDEGGASVMVLADFEGESLEAILSRGRLPPTGVISLGTTLARLVATAHAAELSGGLLPASVLVRPSDNAGILTRCSLTTPETPSPGVLTEEEWPYISPEMTGRLNQPVDQRSDLYSLGVILYRMLVGELPFQAGDSLEWIHCHVARSPRHPQDAAPDTPRALGDIVMKLLAKNPDDRYQTARGLVYDLEQCLLPDGTVRSASFPLASHDTPHYFQIPQRLYGRGHELDLLLRAFTAAADSGWPSHAIVTGQAGIGKTHLINELQRHVLRRGGIFISGKFDQFEVAVPYATVAQSFQDLVRQILGESQAAIETWRHRLLAALDGGGQLVIDLVPQLELIIGPQPALPAVPPLEAGNRFLHVFGQFLSAVARPEHPLVMFLDDLQWADPGSLSFMEHVLTSPGTAHLMVITAYRDDEITAFSSLSRTLLSIRKRLTPVEIHLNPLDAPALRGLIADTVHASPVDCDGLAAQVVLKTGGNPFFVNQFLRTLHEEGSIVFDAQAGRWQWDMARIAASTVTDNVVDLLAERIRRVDPRIQTLLQTGACMGNRFHASSLAAVLGSNANDIAGMLSSAVREGLLLVSPISSPDPVVREESQGTPRLEYRWPHDRVQQAAYMLIPREERNAVHLRIGRALLGCPDLEESVFDLVNQLNHGVAFIRDPAERKNLSQLNMRAGEKARKTVAYMSAREYLAMAVALLEPEAWNTDYETTLHLHLDLAECHFLSGNGDEAERLFSEILKHTDSRIDRARVFRLRIRLFEACGRYGDGLTVTREALALFGVSFPDDDEGVRSLFLEKHGKIQGLVASRSIASLAETEMATDPEMCTVISLFAEGLASVYNARPALLPLFVTHGLTISLKSGLTADTALLFALYGVLLAGVFRDIPSAWEFSLLSLRINETCNDTRSRGMLLYLHAAFIFPWKHHIGAIRPIMDEAFRASVNAGDYVYAGFNRNDVVWQSFEAGRSIDDTLTLSLECASFTSQTGNEMQYRLIGLQQQFLMALKGQRPPPFSFDSPDLPEADCIRLFTGMNFGCGLGFFHIMKQILFFLEGNYEEALIEARNTIPLLPAVMGLSVEASHTFFASLTLTALIPRATPDRRAELLEWLHANLSLLGLWAENCPESFAHRFELVRAEIARIEGRDLEAEQLYEKAIRSAHDNGFLQNEAIGNALVAAFFDGRGLDRIAATYGRDARACFTRWGTTIARDGLRDAPAGQKRAGAAKSTEPDVLSMVKATQAISGEILLDRLLDTLMRVVLENAGGHIAYLFNTYRDGWMLAAEARENGREITVLPIGEHDAVPALLPETIINYTRRSGERVILEDARQPNPFSSDPYIAGVRPRSVLCLPIMRQARMVGILYVENSTTTSAFTNDRLVLLDSIASQAAISIENARLYADLKRENTERRMAEEHIRHMAHHDMLTGLPNRLLFRDRVEQAVSQAHRHDELAAILVVDIDHFKDINDSLGHRAGDRLLQQTGLRAQRCLREGDTVARPGGDEFIFCLPGLRREDEAILVAERILASIRKPFHLDRYQLHVTGSIGISLYPRDAEDVDGLMRSADTAMYHAKSSGRDNFKFFTAELNEAAHRRLTMANQLYEAMDRHRFSVFYQPQVDLSTGRILSAEALIRLHPEDSDIVLPGEFISVAEETGLIVPLGEWVLAEACAQLGKWRSMGHADLRMSVNLSPRQFRVPGFPARTASILANNHIPPAALDLEITESVLMTRNRENAAALEELVGLGVRLAIDDFGTGYSSLSYLQRFPITTLKIDQSFVAGLQRDANDVAIIHTIIAMANTLKLAVIAEGVETTQQVDFLKDSGCHLAQGYYFSKPLPADEFARLLAKQD